jgi:hypothetical protein
MQTLINHKLNIKTDDLILQIQNVALFGISLYSLYSFINYVWSGQSFFSPPVVSDLIQQYGKNKPDFMKPFDNLLYVVFIHVVIDTFFVKKPDVFLHHLCVLGMYTYGTYNNVNMIDGFLFAYSLFKTEISSIFLVLTYWIPEKTTAYAINGLLFFISFFKLRIIDMYTELLQGNHAFREIMGMYPCNNYIVPGIFYVSIYGLYLLNLYWFFIMVKVLYKQLCKNTFINTNKMSHYICSYSFYLHIPLAVYIYSYNKQEHYMYDMAGISILSIASYVYHNDIYQKLCKRGDDDYNIHYEQNHLYFLNDSACIHLRSFFTVYTSYYYSPYFYSLVPVLGVFQSGCFYGNILNVLELETRKQMDTSTFFKIHYVFTFLPIGLEVIAIFLNSPMDIAIPFLLVNISIAFLFMVEPFYKLTHVAFHGLLLAQTYYLCLSHSQAITI